MPDLHSFGREKGLPAVNKLTELRPGSQVAAPACCGARNGSAGIPQYKLKSDDDLVKWKLVFTFTLLVPTG